MIWDRLKSKPASTDYDDQIERIMVLMEAVTPDSEEYKNHLNALERLHKMRQDEKPDRVSRDTIAMVAGSIAGILIIVAFEHNHAITSKGLAQLIKYRP